MKKHPIKIIIATVFFLLSVFFIFYQSPALAQEAVNNLNTVGAPAAGSGLSTLWQILQIFVGLAGLAALGFAVYAGWIWKTNQENIEQANQSKRIIIICAIVFIIALVIFIILTLVLRQSTESSAGPIAPCVNCTVGGETDLEGRKAKIGNEIIERHYPVSNQKDVARNISIAVTFRTAIDPSSIIKNGQVNPDSFYIFKDKDKANKIINIYASSTPDNKTFVFTPAQLLGNGGEKTLFTAALLSGIKKQNGDPLAAGLAGDISYWWSFEVNGNLDVVGPKIESVFPLDSAPRNAAIQINFNEPINPLSAVGEAKNILIKDEKSGQISGRFYLSNMYRAVEFVPDNLCAANDCGDAMYCLPADSQITALVKTLSAKIQAGNAAIFDGLADLSGNALDGNGNGRLEGTQAKNGREPYSRNAPDADKQGDDYTWLFKAGIAIVKDPFVIEKISPNMAERGIGADIMPLAGFGQLILNNSIIKDNVKFSARPYSSEVFYWLALENGAENQRSSVNINHDQFYEKSDYTPQLNAGVMNIYQNCFTPASGQKCSPNPKRGQPYCCNGELSARECGK